MRVVKMQSFLRNAAKKLTTGESTLKHGRRVTHAAVLSHASSSSCGRLAIQALLLNLVWQLLCMITDDRSKASATTLSQSSVELAYLITAAFIGWDCHGMVWCGVSYRIVSRYFCVIPYLTYRFLL